MEGIIFAFVRMTHVQLSQVIFPYMVITCFLFFVSVLVVWWGGRQHNFQSCFEHSPGLSFEHDIVSWIWSGFIVASQRVLFLIKYFLPQNRKYKCDEMHRSIHGRFGVISRICTSYLRHLAGFIISQSALEIWGFGRGSFGGQGGSTWKGPGAREQDDVKYGI